MTIFGPLIEPSYGFGSPIVVAGTFENILFPRYGNQLERRDRQSGLNQGEHKPNSVPSD